MLGAALHGTAARMDFLLEAHGDRFVVPRAITIEQLEGCKRRARMQLPKGVLYRDFYPSIVLSYASGRRTNRKDAADDCEGSGPGVMYAMGLSEFFHERGLQCFSGLQVPPGVDWETFMLRLTGENGKREKPKVLIIILTAGLFHSRPCLKEIDTAIKNKIALLPVRFEDNLPAKEEQWTNLEDQDWEMRKYRVQEKLNSLNNIPNPGTVLNRATALEGIVAELEKHLPAPPSPATSTPTPQPPPPTKPSGGPSGGPRFPVGSRVYVDQGHGEKRLAHVTTYDAANGAFVVEFGERGSGELDTCFDQDLRNADGPLSQLFDSARDNVGSLFGINPLVMESATTGSAAASKPTPSLPDLHPRAALAQAAPPSAVRAPAGPVSCRFWMIKADFLRTFSGKNLPFFQELRAKHPSAFVEVTISYEEVVRRTHVEKILSISHRWMEPTQPDPDGEQLKAIKAFLVSSAGKRIELVWIDGGSMPQDKPKGTRTKEDTADFDIMLSQVCAALCLGHRPFLATLSPRRSRLCYLNTPQFLSPVHLRAGQHALPGHDRPHPLRPLVFVPLLDAVRGVAEHAVCDARRPQVGGWRKICALPHRVHPGRRRTG